MQAKKLPNELEEKSDDEGEVSDEDEGAEVDPEVNACIIFCAIYI